MSKATGTIAVGARVRMSAAGRNHWPDAGNNPHNCVGVVTRNTPSYGTHPYRVDWENGQHNTYREGDLELADATKDMLKVGMRVVYRNKRQRIVGPHSFLDKDGVKRSRLDQLKLDMTSTLGSHNDIMEVYAAPSNVEDFFDINKRGGLLFKREEMTPQQKELKAIEDEMAKLQERAKKLREQV